MSILDVLHHQLRRQVRSPIWARSLIGRLLFSLAGAYFSGLFIVAAWVYPDVVAELSPQRAPLRLLNEHLLTAIVSLTFSRFFLQRSAGKNLRSYRLLPVSDRQLVHNIQFISGLSLFNVIPLVMVLVLAVSTVGPVMTVLETSVWILCVLAALVVSECSTTLLRVAWSRNATLLLSGLSVLGSGMIVGDIVGWKTVQVGSTWLFGPAGRGKLSPVLVLWVAALGMAFWAHYLLRSQLYAVFDGGTTNFSDHLQQVRDWIVEFTPSFVLLDLDLILRNKRPRQMILGSIPLMGGFLFLLSINTSLFNEVLSSFMLSSYIGITYMQFGYSWHGRHFDVLFVTPTPTNKLIRGSLLTFVVLSLISLLTSLPFIAYFSPYSILSVISLFVYNVGTTSLALVGLSSLSRKPMSLDVTTFFNYKGSSPRQLFSIFPSITIPIILSIILNRETCLLLCFLIGVIGICTVPFWERVIEALVHRNRHKMMQGFRGK